MYLGGVTMINFINEANFNEETNSGTVLVDFYADWCGPCRMMSPVLEQVSESIKEVKIVKVNTDENQQLSVKFGISSIPALLLFKDGVVVDQAVGYMAAPQLEAFLKKNI